MLSLPTRAASFRIVTTLAFFVSEVESPNPPRSRQGMLKKTANRIETGHLKNRQPKNFVAKGKFLEEGLAW
jgi:hypothetical protein